MSDSGRLRAAWCLVIAGALGVRSWNALAGPLMWGYDASGHISYVFFLDRYGALPWADQGWSYFHPPLHYVFGWLLARFGDAELLLRGYAMLGSAASLAIAGFAAALTRALTPERRWLPLLSFTAVAFLPVHLYVSPMSGNELTCAFFGAAALAVSIAVERGSIPRLRGDAALGCLIGLALVTKFTGAVFLAAAVGVIALRPPASAGKGGLRSALLSACIVTGIAGLIAAPFYVRNLREFGTPLAMSREHALVSQVESGQAPGERGWRDFVQVSPRLLVDPRPAAPHLVHSVWGTAYVNTWVDTRALWNRLPEADADRLRRARIGMLWLGLAPTALALFGALLAIRDVVRGRRREVYVPLLVWGAATLFVFAAFAVRVPRISALKASYLFGLSLPYGVFLARAVEAWGRGSWKPRFVGAWIAVLASTAAVVYAIGFVHPRRDHNRALGAVYALAGNFDAGRRFYEDRLARAPNSADWLEGLADLELRSGDAARALELYAQLPGSLQRGEPFHRARLGVAAALAGDSADAERHLDFAVAHGGGALAYANRGALRLAMAQFAAAESDLREAVSRDAEIAPAWHNLMVLLERSNRAEEAAAARHRWQHAAGSPPRGYPYDVGVGRLHPGRRPLLWVDSLGLSLARAPYRAESGTDDAPH